MLQCPKTSNFFEHVTLKVFHHGTWRKHLYRKCNVPGSKIYKINPENLLTGPLENFWNMEHEIFGYGTWRNCSNRDYLTTRRSLCQFWGTRFFNLQWWCEFTEPMGCRPWRWAHWWVPCRLLIECWLIDHWHPRGAWSSGRREYIPNGDLRM